MMIRSAGCAVILVVVLSSLTLASQPPQLGFARLCTSSWQVLPQRHVILPGETIYVEAKCSGGSKTSPDVIVVPVRTSVTNPGGKAVTLTETGSYTKIYRGTTTFEGLAPAADDDSITEYASIDRVVNPPDSNNHDTNQFQVDMGSGAREFRGRAEDLGNGLADSPCISVASVSFMEAAGVEYIRPVLGKRRNQIQNQADFFYISGHGAHAAGTLTHVYTDVAGDNETTVSASDVSTHWGTDLRQVIVAGCSVLDVDDLNCNYEGDAHGASPGRAWATTGPRFLMGYNYAAPLDNNLGDPDYTSKIVHAWYEYYSTGQEGTIHAWLRANSDYAECGSPAEIDGPKGRTLNSCGIDANPEASVYWYWDYYDESSGNKSLPAMLTAYPF